jgi:hypothetical protein
MDNEKIALLRELLSDKDVKNTLKKILLEDEVKLEKPIKKSTKKIQVNKKEEFKTEKVIDKNSKEYGRSIFVDDLSQAIEEEIDGKNINLVNESKKISKNTKTKIPRKKPSLRKINCQQCKRDFRGIGGYLCDNCIKGKISA